MFTFDFEVLDPPEDADAYAEPQPWLPAFEITGATGQVVARDVSSGLYVLCELPDRACFCVHIDAQGYAVSLAQSFEHMVALVLAVPYWREALESATGGSLGALRQAVERLELEVQDDLPALPAARADLLGFLELPPLGDAVEYLHRMAVLGRDMVAVMSPHGWRYQALVGS